MKKLSVVLGLVLLLASFAHSQATLSSTTLSAAASSTSTTIKVTSASGFAAGEYAYVDRELMLISSVSGTTITVVRGYSGTSAVGHANGATVYQGPADHFSAFDRSGTCTSTSELVLPVINVKTGKIFTCSNSLWREQTLHSIELLATMIPTDGISPSYKGIYGDITIDSATTGATQYFKAIQGLATVSTGANPAEVWGVYGIVNVTGTGNVYAPWPVVGELDVAGTGNFGTAQDNAFISAGYFHSFVNATKTILGGIDAPLVGDINSATGRRKADAAVLASLNGAINQSTAGAGAAFLVRDFNTGANFDYGLDMYFSSGSYSNVFGTADVRLSSGAQIRTGTGAPTAGDCAAGTLGSIYLNRSGGANTTLYVCQTAGSWNAVTP